MASISRFDLIKEAANVNIEKIFTLWGLNFTKIAPDEYDFLSPFRNDKCFGACRFNTRKGRGADFAGLGVTNAEIHTISSTFDKSDFAGLHEDGRDTFGFDIISLCMRINSLSNYNSAATFLANQLNNIQSDPDFIKVSMQEVELKKKCNEVDRAKKLQIATRTWDRAQDLQETLGDIYLRTRAIELSTNHKSIKFHPAMINKELNDTLPVLLFKVSEQPGSELKAIHRIYLSKDGKSKANVENPKMALGDIVGSAIWFGRRDSTLCIAEGPENALSILCLGFAFVCSTVSANNFSNVRIPEYVRKLILFPDNDRAGRINTQKAKDKYAVKVKDIKIVFPKDGDFNDMLVKARNG